MNQIENNDREIDLLQLLCVLQKKVVSIILIGTLVTILMVGIKLILVSGSEEPYDFVGTTKIFVDKSVPATIGEGIRTYLVSSEMLNKVNEDVGLAFSMKELKSMVHLDDSTDTLISIHVSGKDENLVHKVTDSIAKLGVREIRIKFDFASAIIVEPAFTTDLSDTNTANFRNEIIRFGVIGFILGVFLAIFVYVVLFMYDTTLKDESDIENYLNIPVLGIVPAIKGTKKYVEQNKKNRKLRLSQYISDNL